MTTFIFKTIVAALLISFSSWLAGKKPALAGFITALPLTTLIALAFTQTEWRDADASVAYAKSIFYAVPISLLFFLPFLLSKKLNLGFWSAYGIGFLLLIGGYFLHQWLTKSA